MLIIIHGRITFTPTMMGCGEIFEEDGWEKGYDSRRVCAGKKRPRCFLRRHVLLYRTPLKLSGFITRLIELWMSRVYLCLELNLIDSNTVLLF
jgi:hypothetical protein